MTIVADESIDKQIVDRLRNDGHHVLFIAESEPSIDDEKVLLRSRELNGLLITADGTHRQNSGPLKHKIPD